MTEESDYVVKSLDVWLKNEGSDEWIFVGQSEPSADRPGWHRWPDWSPFRTGGSVTLVMEYPGTGPPKGLE